MGNFRKLVVWQKAYQLTLNIYQAIGGFPEEELFGMTSQMRRAAASIPANIAEGSGRGGDIELYRFCQIALGSANELEFFTLLSRDLMDRPDRKRRICRDTIYCVRLKIRRIHFSLSISILSQLFSLR